MDMKKDVFKKIFTILIVGLFIFTSTSVVGESLNNVDENKDFLLDQYINENLENKVVENKISNVLNNNSKGRYFIFSTGIRASSYFVKLPRLLTQRGIIFSGEIWYRSNFAFTIVFQRNNSKIKLIDFERGTHRVIIFGIGHSTFTRPHIFSFGRVTAFTKLKPIII